MLRIRWRTLTWLAALAVAGAAASQTTQRLESDTLAALVTRLHPATSSALPSALRGS